MGVDAIKETINHKFPMGCPYLAIEKLSRIYKPKDGTSKIATKSEIEAIASKQANDYRVEVNHAMSKYDHKLNDTELLEIMVGKTGNMTYISRRLSQLRVRLH